MTRLSVARAAGSLLFVLLEMFVLLVPFRARALPGPAGLTAEMDDPAQVAWTFYESIDQGVGTGDFRPAYNLMSRNAQKRRSYAAFSKGFVTTRSVVVEWIWPLSQDESEAVLEIDLVATDEIDGALRSVRYETVYTLVRERGQWRLDHAKTEQPPADVVRAFWDHLDRGIATGDCRAAYDLLSAARREDCTYAEFAEVLDTVRRVRAEDVQLLERTEREATVRAVVYIAEEMDGTLDMSQRDVEFTLVREGSAWRVDWLDGTDRTMGDDVPELVYADPGTYHIGDEALRGWLPLTGLCWTDSFWVDGSGSASLLELELYGADSASQVLINGQWVATLPSQPTYWPGRRPNWWSERVSLPLGDVSLSEGWNTITLCATPLPDDPDSDDLQLRNIRVLADLEPVVPDLYLELGTASLPMRHGDTGKG